MNDSQKVKVDGVEYLLSDLSEEAKGMMVNIKVIDQELERLQRQVLIHQTARQTFVATLQRALPSVETH